MSNQKKFALAVFLTSCASKISGLSNDDPEKPVTLYSLDVNSIQEVVTLALTELNVTSPLNIHLGQNSISVEFINRFGFDRQKYLIQATYAEGTNPAGTQSIGVFFSGNTSGTLMGGPRFLRKVIEETETIAQRDYPSFIATNPNPISIEKAYTSTTPIYREMISEPFIYNFNKNICVDMSSETCKTKWSSTFLARLVTNYKSVSSKGVLDHCDAYPIECKDPEYIEKLFRTEYIRIKISESMSQQSNIRQSRANEAALRSRQLENTSNALEAFSKSLSPKPSVHQNFCGPNSLPPFARHGCRNVCVNGSWAEVCN